MLTSTKNKIAVAALLIANFAMASGVVASLSLEPTFRTLICNTRLSRIIH